MFRKASAYDIYAFQALRTFFCGRCIICIHGYDERNAKNRREVPQKLIKIGRNRAEKEKIVNNTEADLCLVRKIFRESSNTLFWQPDCPLALLLLDADWSASL